MIFLFVLLLRRLHRSTRTYTLVPYSTLVPSPLCASQRARQTQTSAPPYSSLRRRRGEGDQPKAGGGEMRNLSPFPLHHRPRRRSPSPCKHGEEQKSLTAPHPHRPRQGYAPRPPACRCSRCPHFLPRHER